MLEFKCAYRDKTFQKNGTFSYKLSAKQVASWFSSQIIWISMTADYASREKE